MLNQDGELHMYSLTTLLEWIYTLNLVYFYIPHSVLNKLTNAVNMYIYV